MVAAVYGLLAVAMFVAAVLCDFPATLTLERAFPANLAVDMKELRARDSARHGRLLQQSVVDGVVDFSVEGTFDPFLVGLYFTRVQLGSPPREFYVQIDTGSDVLWVSCSPCSGCPESSGLQQVQLNSFDPKSSSTASLILCEDERCSLGARSSDSVCSSQTDQCSYKFQYGDGSGTSGFYVSDMLHLNTVVGGSMTTNASAPVVFGCSTMQTGDLTKSDRAVDGIFGFGQHGMSVISQLSSNGQVPKAFSHCLRGGDGGGILVFGEIVEPNIVYSPLVASQPHYNLNMQSISVNGQILPIDSSVFATTNSRGTIVDTGTTLAYLADEAYDPFVRAITNAVSQSVRLVIVKGNQCYLISSSINDIFPQVSLNFAGSASMILDPEEYLLQQNSVGGSALWCIGFQKMQGGQGITILGDLVLKDKIFVYDLAEQRIGWANYDCSMAVNVSTAINTGRSEYVNERQRGDSSALRPRRSLVFLFLFLLIHIQIIAVLGNFVFQ